MAEKYIRIRGKLVAVTEEVYYTYYHMDRQCCTQAEKDSRRWIVSYDALDTDDGLGVDLLVDKDFPGVEDTAIAEVMAEKLHHCLAQLPERERTRLEKIYFYGMTERQAAQSLGIPCMTLHDRKIKALQTLKKMMTE